MSLLGGKCWRCGWLGGLEHFRPMLTPHDLLWCARCWERVGVFGPAIACAECGGSMGYPDGDQLKCLPCGRVVG